MKNVKRIKYDLNNILLFDYLTICKWVNKLIVQES